MNLHHGDCLDVLRTMSDNSVDSIVTDPPYGLSFMGKKWDYDVPSEDIWRECLRVLKPGGHLLAFAGTRTQHRMAVRIEDAGFEIRDMIAWVYGSGYPKSLNVGKAIDKAAGAEREVVGNRGGGAGKLMEDRPWNQHASQTLDITAPATEAAKQWDGWGTALKPAMEMITVARKPLIGTVAANVLEHGTGAINVDGCRVGYQSDSDKGDPLRFVNSKRSVERTFGKGGEVGDGGMFDPNRQGLPIDQSKGRWPANFIHSGCDEVVGLFPVTGGESKPRTLRRLKGTTGWSGGSQQTDDAGAVHCDSGSAARFFYCAKASKRDRDEGCEGLDEKATREYRTGNAPPNISHRVPDKVSRNFHPTVKPTDLMRYLCRLVTPPGGIVLDPFMGSGSTGKAALLEGFQFIGIERDAEYLEIARARIQHPNQSELFKP